MNWEAIGAIGELLGSVGVLITLVYLAMQIRQNTDSLEENRKYARAQMYQARANSVLQIMADHGSAMTPLLTKDGIDFSRVADLPIEQQASLHRFARSLDIHSDNIIHQREIGLLEVSDESLQTDDSLGLLYELSRHLNLELRPSTKGHMAEYGFDVSLLP